MDFKTYYSNQATGNTPHYPVYRGTLSFQRGFGLGGIFRQFFSWALPILKEHALPLAKNVGKELINNAANVANDAIEGRNISNSVKENLRKTLSKLHTGSGYKMKRKNKKSKFISNKKKRILDIFD